MNTFLLNRALGSVSPQALARAQNERLLHSLQPAKDVSLSYKEDIEGQRPHERSQLELDDDHGIFEGDDRTSNKTAIAHPAGVNSITIDRFEGR